MKIYDISWPISENMTGYKDKRNVKISHVKEFESDGVRESIIVLGSHSGTHIDAPSHFLKDGKSIEDVDLNTTIGPAYVIDCTDSTGGITHNDLKNKEIAPHSIVLLKTTNSALSPIAPFAKQFTYLEKSGAAYLVEKKIKAVGIDYLGIEREQPDHETHVQLFQAGITIIEGLRLQEIQEGSYFLCCLPLATQNTEASPARAVLIEGL